jgi:ferrous iron transport protein A
MMKRRWRMGKHRLHHHTTSHQPGEVPLSALHTGEKGIVTRIAGGRGMLERMTSLGFVPGTEVFILQNFRHGPIIVRARQARIALGRGVAGRIRMRRSKV